jgi:F-type H+-transporting ATPase subunit delta
MKANRRTRRAARQLYRLSLVDGALDRDRARLVADRLASSHRRGALPVLSGFLRLVRLDRDRHTARVESAAPLPDTAREQIRSGLARTHGAALETSFAENPALIGGVRVKVGSDVYDGTIRAKLAALAARL